MRIVPPLTAAAPAKSAAATAAKSSLRLEARGPSTRPLPPTGETREQLERELDRVQHGLLGERAGFGQQLNWLLLSQALLLNAFLIVLVFGWSTPLPGRRALLAGLALFAAVLAILIVLALRGARDSMLSLQELRKTIEARLHKDFQRAPLFAPRALVTRSLATAAGGLLPAAIVAGWIALGLYALAAPFPPTAGPQRDLGAPTSASTSPRPLRAQDSSRSAAAHRQAAPAPGEPAAAEHAEPEPVAAAHRNRGFKW